MINQIISIMLLVSVAACNTPRLAQQMKAPQPSLLDSLMAADRSLDSIVRNKKSLNVQVIYTQIDRDAANNPTFTDYTFNVDDKQYFYPASTVKMPVALLALEKLNELKIAGLSRNTSMVTDSNFSRQQKVLTDPRTVDGRPTLAQYIQQIFIVSDNEAFNRLYEFVGQEEINDRLHKKDFTQTEILHRLSVTMSEEENRHTNAVSFYDTSGNLIHHQQPAYNKKKYSARSTNIGNGYYQGSQLVSAPFDFSKKNRFTLTDLHQVLRILLFPEAVSARQRFNLTDNDYRFLYKAMSTMPTESRYPAYDTTAYWDAYVKFLLFGSEKTALPNNIRVFNKVGDAYGFLTDVAYVVDFDNKVEFMLSATILCNSDGIFNDDHYDYDEVGFPFMKNLGQLIYKHEMSRQKKYVPDLSKFIFNYKEEDAP